MLRYGESKNSISIDSIIDKEYQCVNENIQKQRIWKLIIPFLVALFIYSVAGIIPLFFTIFCCSSLNIVSKTMFYFIFSISWVIFSLGFGLSFKYANSHLPRVEFSDRLFHMMYKVFQIIEKYNIPRKEREMNRNEKIRCVQLIRKFRRKLGLEVSKEWRMPSFTETEYYKNFQIILSGLTEKIQPRIEDEKDFDKISKMAKAICAFLIGRRRLSDVAQDMGNLTVHSVSEEGIPRTIPQKLFEYAKSDNPFVAYGGIILLLTLIIIPIYIIIWMFFTVDLTTLISIIGVCYTIPAFLLVARRK